MIKDKLSAFNPDVLILGIKSLNRDTVEEVKKLHADFPRIGIILLFMTYHTDNIKLLRKLAEMDGAGMAIFSKQSLERVNQLYQIIISVSEGHVILDPALTSLLFTEKERPLLLRGLTRRELEVLNLLAQGYTNLALAEALCVDIKTIRHHLNNIYSKLKADADFNYKHPRVSAARLYLEEIGELISSRSS